MKEATAIEKICPMVCNGGFPGKFASDETKQDYKCRGSECMMWETEGDPDYGDCGLKYYSADCNYPG